MNTSFQPTQKEQSLLFISGRLSLDLSHTGGKRTQQGAYFERLHQPSDLSRWLSECELALHDVIANKEDLALAHELREAIWYAAHAVAHGKTIAALDRDIINKFASYELPVMQLDKSGALYWQKPIPVRSILAYIARDAVDLIGTETRTRLRECANPQCPLLFVDMSRPNKRRWCSMERCGLMEKTARFRSKPRTGLPQ